MSDDINKLIGRLRSYVRSSKYIITEDIFAAADTIEALRAERDRLKAALEGKQADPAPVCEWKPIGTAPKDGAFICGAWVYGRRWVTRSLFWNGHNWECPITDRYYGPTRWMPLPPPPEVKE